MDMKQMREKLAQLNNKGAGQKVSNPNIWKPEAGENNIRIVPLKSNPDWPFQELYFHYNLQGFSTHLSPLSYGERDPLAEFSDSLVGEGGLSKDEYKAAKKYYPSVRTYLPIVVRGKESEGVKFWAFGASTLKALGPLMSDEEVGDITDPQTGTDLKVTFKPKEPNAGPNDYPETIITLRRNSSVLTDDKELLKKILTEQPVLIDQFKKHSYDELYALLERKLAPTPSAAPSAPSKPSQTEDDTPLVVRKAPSKAPKQADEDDFDQLFG